MAKKKINTQIRMRVASASLEFVLEVSPIDCFISLASFVCCVSRRKDLPEFALTIPLITFNKLFHVFLLLI